MQGEKARENGKMGRLEKDKNCSVGLWGRVGHYGPFSGGLYPAGCRILILCGGVCMFLGFVRSVGEALEMERAALAERAKQWEQVHTPTTTTSTTTASYSDEPVILASLPRPFLRSPLHELIPVLPCVVSPLVTRRWSVSARGGRGSGVRCSRTSPSSEQSWGRSNGPRRCVLFQIDIEGSAV